MFEDSVAAHSTGTEGSDVGPVIGWTLAVVTIFVLLAFGVRQHIKVATENRELRRQMPAAHGVAPQASSDSPHVSGMSGTF
jgi:hypothetical protein